MRSESRPEEHLPSPQPERTSSRGMVLLALLLLGVAGGGIWWATRDADTREELRSQAAQTLHKAQNSAVSTLLDALSPTPPKPPLPEVRAQATDAVASGPADAGGSPAPEDIALLETLTAGTPVDADADARKREDRIVRPAFVQDAARWMASCYQPGNTGEGRLKFSAQWANARFATRTQGIALPEGAEFTSRAALLRYLLKPGVLQSLYDKYGDSFMQEFDTALRQPEAQKPLSDKAVRGAYRLYADYLASVAGALDSVAATPGLSAELRRMEEAGQHSVDLNGRITEAVFQMDEAREAGDSAAMQEAQQRINVLTSQYRLANSEKARIRQQTIALLKQRGGRSLDDATVLFLAQWVNRRMAVDKNAQAAAQAAAGVLRALAARMQQRQ